MVEAYRTSSNLREQHYHRDSKVDRVLMHKHVTHLAIIDGVVRIGLMRFDMLEPPRTSA